MDVVQRVKAILTTPQSEWGVIAREPGEPSYLFTNYVAILALIPAVAGFVGHSLFGAYPIFAGLVSAVFGYVLTFVIVYVLAVVIDALAPTFGGQRDFGSALKLAVYSQTPAWVAAIFLLIPALGFLTILGLYGLYLLWIGLPILMRSPAERTLLYVVAIFVVWVVLALIIGFIQIGLFGIPRVV